MPPAAKQYGVMDDTVIGLFDEGIRNRRQRTTVGYGARQDPRALERRSIGHASICEEALPHSLQPKRSILGLLRPL